MFQKKKKGGKIIFPPSPNAIIFVIIYVCYLKNPFFICIIYTLFPFKLILALSQV